MAHSQPSGGSRLHKVIKTMRREKITFVKIFITVLLLASFPITIILTSTARNNQDIRSKATQATLAPTKIIFIPFSFSKDKDDDYLFEFRQRAQVRNGFVPQNVSASAPQYTALVLDETGRQIASPQNFSLPQLVATDSIDTQSRKGKAELKKVSANSHGLALPYVDNASFLKIINPKGETVEIISIQDATPINNIIDMKEIRGDEIDKKTGFVQKAQAAGGTLNIAIIGDNYNGDSLQFQSDVNDIAAGLLSIEPFKLYKTNIVFYTQLSAVQICSYSGSLSCNDTQALQQASGLPYDKVYILYNGPYGGYAYVDATLSYGTNATGMATAAKQGLFIHELAGHVLGGLMDEYSYGTTGLSYAPNCSDSSSCPSWSTISGLGCYSSCGYTNLYRATDNSSVMNTAFLNGSISFDSFSSQVIAGKLVPYFNPSPPTPTIPPPLPTPTITPLPSPTSAPTVTLQPTPTLFSQPRGPATAGEGDIISITPSITVAPSITDTPTPTQPPSCNFPNFCKKGNLCAPENTLTISCAGSELVCCKGQTAVNNITPTITQRFELLPTIPVIGQDRAADTPTPSPVPTRTTTNTTDNTSVPVKIPPATTVVEPTSQQIALIDGDVIQIILPSPTAVRQNQYNIPSAAAAPTATNQENYLSYPTVTPYKIENILFERATPTSPPRPSVLDILAAPSRFMNNIVKSFFSLFSGK